MNLADCPNASTHIELTRAELEALALQFARRERELHELTARLDQQLSALAQVRKLLLAILWPRRENAA